MLGAEQVEIGEALGRLTDDQTLCEILLREIHNSKGGTLSSLHHRGAVLFAEGQLPSGLYVLRSGRVKISISSSEGRILILRLGQAPELLGLNAVVRNIPYDVTVETIEPCRTDFISRADFMELVAKSNEARVCLCAILSKEVTRAVEHARALHLPRSSAARLARLLLTLCAEIGDQGFEGVRLNPGLTHEEMAQMIGTSRETVTRLFAELKRKQIVGLVDNSIVIRNRRALESLACS